MDEGLPPSVDVSPEEHSAVERALRELGVEPVPRDVAVRLERRLEDELGPSPPVRTPRRPRWLRPTFVLAPIAAAAIIAVAVVASTGGGSSDRPTAARAPAVTATASPSPGAGNGSAAAPSTPPLPKQAIEAPRAAVDSLAGQAASVADAAKTAARQAARNVCKGHKKDCKRSHTSTTP
jgi:hypothetical protein